MEKLDAQGVDATLVDLYRRREAILGFQGASDDLFEVDLDRPALPVYEELLKLGIIVRPVGNYGLPEHLRISIGKPEQNQRLLDALHRVL